MLYIILVQITLTNKTYLFTNQSTTQTRTLSKRRLQATLKVKVLLKKSKIAWIGWHYVLSSLTYVTQLHTYVIQL